MELDKGFLLDMAKGFHRPAPLNDEYCPTCRQPGNPKVCDAQGRWHYKCTTPGCDIAYYLPDSTYIEKRLSPEANAALNEKVHREVTEMLANKIWICRHHGNDGKARYSEATTIPEGDPIPDGWHALGTADCNKY